MQKKLIDTPIQYKSNVFRGAGAYMPGGDSVLRTEPQKTIRKNSADGSYIEN